MSRHISIVSASKAASVFGLPVNEMETSLGHGSTGQELVVKVAHGYDDMCGYFCDLMPDCEVGVSCGCIGTIGKGDYFNAMTALGLSAAANAVALDIPY